MSLLEMKHIKKHFDDVEVLQDISLKVDEGQVLAITSGPSGSGKSTLLRCATNLETPMRERSIMKENMVWYSRISIFFPIFQL